MRLRLFSRYAAAAAAALSLLCDPVLADQAPLKVLVGYPAGGSADAAARALAEPLATALGRRVIVDDRPGAGGMIAAQLLKSAPADDNTVLLVNDHMVAMIPWTMQGAGYDPVKDFTSLGQVAKYNLAFSASIGSGFKSVADYVGAAKASHSSLVYAIPAPGSTMQFVGYVLAKSAGVELVPMPYKGSAPLVTDLLGNQIASGITPVTDVVEYQKAGKLHVLAVTGKARSGLMPEVPTFGELGYKGLDKDGFIGFYAPAKASPEFVAHFSQALRTVLLKPEVRERFLKLGFEPAYAEPAEFTRTVAADSSYWGAVVKQSGFRPQ